MILKSAEHHRINNDIQLTIDFAGLEETKAISQVLAKSFYSLPEFATWIYPFLQFTIGEDIRHRLRSHAPHYCCLVAKIAPPNYAPASATVSGNRELSRSRDSNILDRNVKVVGTIEIALRSPSLWSTAAQYPYISNLAVADQYRGLGIGKQLLAKCQQIAQEWGYSETRLHVLDNNDAAKRLYYKDGYQISQIETNWSNFWFDYSPRLLLKKQNFIQ